MSRHAARIERRPWSRSLSGAVFCLILLALALGACEKRPPTTAAPEQLSLTPVSFVALPGWRADEVGAALPAFRRSCAKLLAEPDKTPSGPDGTALESRDWRPACRALSDLRDGDDAAVRVYFERWFQPYRAGNRGDPEGLFTGYYEPELHGSRRPSKRYTVPLYGPPQDLVTANLGEFDDSLKGKRIAGHVVGGLLKPYSTRAEIEAGALKGKAPVLLWVDDPIAAFFLAVQGSGRVILEDGSVVRLGYVAQNGRSYRSIGRILVERGAMALEDVSLQSIRGWLEAHPGEAKALMDQNTAYVFFRELTEDGPIGTEGVALTLGRSLAVDPAFVSLGVPIWLDIESPQAGQRIRRLVVAQDTGSAIKGAVRGDLFWGFGPQAEDMAGRMRSRGSYYLLLPRTEAR